MNRKKWILWILLAVSLVFCGYLWMTPDKYPEAEAVRYPVFAESLEQGEIVSAEINGDRVYYQLRQDEKMYYTSNPDYDRFLEELLLKDVTVTQSSDGEDILYFVMDMMFNLVFFGMIGGAAFWLLRRSRKQFPVIRHTDCSFDDIAGMEQVKKDMSLLVKVMKNAGAYAQKGVRMPHGILLAGPPGNGKTLFARALAGEAGMNFIATKATDFQSMYMSIGPSKVKALFRKARKMAPCLIFIDEFDGLGEKRSYAGQGIDKENNRIITAMLNELDGFEQHAAGVVVIAATNNIQALDPALVRPGRFDRKYLIDNPDRSTRLLLIDMYLRDHKLAVGLSKNSLAEVLEGCSCAAIEAVLNEAGLAAEAAGSDTIGPEELQIAMKMVQSQG